MVMKQSRLKKTTVLQRSDDWAKGGAGIKYSYTIELPDTGRHGFLLPSNKARGVGEEAIALTTAMISSIQMPITISFSGLNSFSMVTLELVHGQ